MGLLDNLFNSEDGRMGLGLLAAASARSDGAGFGQRLNEAVGSVDQWKQQQAQAKRAKMMEEMQMMQIEQAKAQAQDAATRKNIFAQNFQQAIPASADGMGPTRAMGFDHNNAAIQMGQAGMGEQAMDLMAKFAPKPADYRVVGNSLLQIGNDGVKPVYSEPEKVSKPNEVQEYEYAKSQGYDKSFNDFRLENSRAKGTNVSLKVDNKMGESLAGQVGPMAKDSRIQTQGAVKMYDAATRLESALDSNKVTSGPFATQIQTAKQLIQVVGGGNDDSIRQTRQAIKSLAQMAVEARKQLQGQGQVTESEAAAVAKADAGELNDLTTGELRDLVTLTKRASHYQAKAHSDMIGTLGGKDETRNLVPFYNVQGLEPLLKHNPTLPKIGGDGWSIKPVGP
jgi:hypothetical protein